MSTRYIRPATVALPRQLQLSVRPMRKLRSNLRLTELTRGFSVRSDGKPAVSPATGALLPPPGRLDQANFATGSGRRKPHVLTGSGGPPGRRRRAAGTAPPGRPSGRPGRRSRRPRRCRRRRPSGGARRPGRRRAAPRGASPPGRAPGQPGAKAASSTSTSRSTQIASQRSASMSRWRVTQRPTPSRLAWTAVTTVIPRSSAYRRCTRGRDPRRVQPHPAELDSRATGLAPPKHLTERNPARRDLPADLWCALLMLRRFRRHRAARTALRSACGSRLGA